MCDFVAAKAACEKAIELDPRYVKAWAKKGDIEFFMKEYHKALETYKRGLEIEPNNSLCTQVRSLNASKMAGCERHLYTRGGEAATVGGDLNSNGGSAFVVRGWQRPCSGSRRRRPVKPIWSGRLMAWLTPRSRTF
jgi:tetratricopeptide (TPR) repeat protein